MNILAIDPATKCGWAISPTVGGTWDLSTRRDESKGMKLIRFRNKLVELCQTDPPDVIAYEAARGGVPGRLGALVASAELQGVLKAFCEDRKIEYRGYSPAEVKKHATGKGNAKKDAMIAAARSKGWSPEDDNHADALWILDLAKKDLS